MKKKMKRVFVCLSVLLFMPMYASALMLKVVDGQLMGASGVKVGANFYNVAFKDGTCADLFGGCDQESDFAFGDTPGDADAAALALLTQVLLDVDEEPFDSVPNRTFGIERDSMGTVLTPYGFDTTILQPLVIAAWNWGGNRKDHTMWDYGPTMDTCELDAFVWAVWTPAQPVPEPATMILLFTGVIGLAKISRKKRNH